MLPTSPSPQEYSSSSSSPKRALEASKWIDFVFLPSEGELLDLLQSWKGIKLCRSRGLFPRNASLISVEEVVKGWGEALHALEEGRESDLSPFYLYMTLDDNALFHQIVEGGRERVYPILPCLISQPGRLTYSSLDATFRVSAFGPETIPWGLKWSFPQIYLDPLNREILKGSESPNAPLFDQLRRWIRENTFPVAFLVEGKKIQTPYRLGNQMRNLRHPLLESKGIALC